METSRPSFRERVGLKKKKGSPPPVVNNDGPPSSLLAPDSWVWELASALGASSSGVAGGSLAAKAVAMASASGSATTLASTLQTMGAATLASPVGLCLVTSCAVVGGSVLVGKTLFSHGSTKIADDAWILVEANDSKSDAPEADRFAIAVFDDENAARKAFKRSRVASRALFGPGKKLVLSRRWQESFRQVAAAM